MLTHPCRWSQLIYLPWIIEYNKDMSISWYIYIYMCVLLYISTRKLCYWIVIGIRIQVNYGAPPDCRRVGGHRSLPHGKSLFWSRKNTSPRIYAKWPHMGPKNEPIQYYNTIIQFLCWFAPSSRPPDSDCSQETEKHQISHRKSRLPGWPGDVCHVEAKVPTAHQHSNENNQILSSDVWMGSLTWR